MNKLIVNFIFSFFIGFIFVCFCWLVSYQLQGASGHLNLSYMISSLNNDFDSLSISFDNFISDIKNAVLNFGKIFEIKFGSTSNNIFKIIINGINYIIKLLTFPINVLSALISSAKSIWGLVDSSFNVLISFLKFILFPKFV